MDKQTAEFIAKEIRHEYAKHELHVGKITVEVEQMIAGGWMVQIY